jgi:hypothetical protein
MADHHNIGERKVTATSPPTTSRTPGVNNSQTQSKFFTLPLEIRDQIYEEAFGNEFREFGHGENIIEAYEFRHAVSIPTSKQGPLVSLHGC